MYEVTEEMLAETYRSSLFAKPFDDFWGPGVAMSETDYLAMTLGYAPRFESVCFGTVAPT